MDAHTHGPPPAAAPTHHHASHPRTKRVRRQRGRVRKETALRDRP
jgi:hypothetical protein